MRDSCACCGIATGTLCPGADKCLAQEEQACPIKICQKQQKPVTLCRSFRLMTVLSVSSSDLQPKSQDKQPAQAVMRRGSHSLLLPCIPGLQDSLELRRVRAALISTMSPNEQICVQRLRASELRDFLLSKHAQSFFNVSEKDIAVDSRCIGVIDSAEQEYSAQIGIFMRHQLHK